MAQESGSNRYICMNRPNILFLLIDCLRADAVVGKDRGAQTPTLDRLARSGVACTQAIASASSTTPCVGQPADRQLLLRTRHSFDFRAETKPGSFILGRRLPGIWLPYLGGSEWPPLS